MSAFGRKQTFFSSPELNIEPSAFKVDTGDLVSMDLARAINVAAQMFQPIASQKVAPKGRQ